jgi:hypothetical protein
MPKAHVQVFRYIWYYHRLATFPLILHTVHPKNVITKIMIVLLVLTERNKFMLSISGQFGNIVATTEPPFILLKKKLNRTQVTMNCIKITQPSQNILFRFTSTFSTIWSSSYKVTAFCLIATAAKFHFTPQEQFLCL